MLSIHEQTQTAKRMACRFQRGSDEQRKMNFFREAESWRENNSTCNHLWLSLKPCPLLAAHLSFEALLNGGSEPFLCFGTHWAGPILFVKSLSMSLSIASSLALSARYLRIAALVNGFTVCTARYKL